MTKTPDTYVDPYLEDFGGPAVESAYKPSGQGTLLGTALMTLGGIMAGILFGSLSPVIAERVMDFCFAFGWLGVIVGMFLMFFLIPALSGMGIGWVVAQAAWLGKSRDVKACVWIALLSSLVTIVLYCIARIKFYEAEAFDSIIDWLKMIFICGWVAAMAAYNAAETMGKQPFCESCHAYMRRRKSRKIPVVTRADLLSAGKEGRFEDLFQKSFLGGEDTANPLYSIVHCFYCSKCRAKGFLNLYSYKVTVKPLTGRRETSIEDRCIFSVALPSESVRIFIPQKKSAVAKV